MLLEVPDREPARSGPPHDTSGCCLFLVGLRAGFSGRHDGGFLLVISIFSCLGGGLKGVSLLFVITAALFDALTNPLFGFICHGSNAIDHVVGHSPTDVLQAWSVDLDDGSVVSFVGQAPDTVWNDVAAGMESMVSSFVYTPGGGP